jgi:hypothetical protein
MRNVDEMTGLDEEKCGRKNGARESGLEYNLLSE